jgi:hypothetical protein
MCPGVETPGSVLLSLRDKSDRSWILPAPRAEYTESEIQGVTGPAALTSALTPPSYFLKFSPNREASFAAYAS